MATLSFLLGVLLATAVIACSPSNPVSDLEWTSYKFTYAKLYSSVTEERNARYYYGINKEKIQRHNDRGLESYTLGINQFSDMNFLEFAANFPPTADIPSFSVPYVRDTVTPQDSFSYNSLGLMSPVVSQSLQCNSGWAYASATAIQIYHALISGIPQTGLLSAQNFIDCAGAAKACVNQVSQAAFDYLTQYNQKLYPAAEYPNRYAGQGMCIVPGNQASGKTLRSYSNIPNGDDATLKYVVNYVAPVVIKFNPASFEFMHFKEGIFTQPSPTRNAAHYLTIIGFGRDTQSSIAYWLAQNSFGVNWGENGFIRIEMNPDKPIALSAIFPLQIG